MKESIKLLLQEAKTAETDASSLIKLAQRFIGASGAIEGNSIRLRNLVSALDYEYKEFESTSNPELEHIRGAIVTDQQERTIYVRSDFHEDNNENSKYKRMTLAHELGHAILHQDSQIDWHMKDTVKLSPEDKERESDANKLAHELVMPRDLFIDAYNIFGGSWEKLSGFFMVPEVKVDKRISYLKEKGLWTL